ncbi:MAG: TSUP family transporter [Demequina sp.]|uniref:TSUP family transporter n=1 Tax=Demequina sp. TaxID=2050685 RepID=UPI003A89CE85
MSVAQWALAGGVVAIAAIVQAATGMGFSIVAVPFLALTAPALGTVSILATTVCVMLVVTWRERRALSPGDLGVLLAGGAPGIVSGTLVARATPERATHVMVGAVVVAASAASLLAWRVAMTRTSLAIAGACGGALTPVAALPGPPLAVTYRPADVHRMRATMSAFFAATSLASIATLTLARSGESAQVARDAVTGLAFAPAVVLGIVLSAPLVRRLSPTLVQRSALWLSLASGLILIVTALIP